MKLQIKKSPFHLVAGGIDYLDKYFIVDEDSNGRRYLHKDGVVRQSTGKNSEGWFDTAEDVISALNLYFSQQEAQ